MSETKKRTDEVMVATAIPVSLMDKFRIYRAVNKVSLATVLIKGICAEMDEPSEDYLSGRWNGRQK